MPALRSTVVTASYQMLGSTKPKIVMEEHFEAAVKRGLIESGTVLDIRPIAGNDFFTIIFTVDVPLDTNQSLGDLFSDAKAITDQVVRDTDTVVEDARYTN